MPPILLGNGRCRMQANSVLFTDEQMQDFITNGYVTVKTDLPRSFHEAIYRKTQDLIKKEGNLGNNILPRIPELQAVFEEQRVRGALTSILGKNYVMHSHRHPHQNRPHSDGQGFHKDSYWGYQKIRHHRTRWAMAFYYPQDSPKEIGPSSILPGTQYYSTRLAENNENELPLSGEAGTVTIIHFDLWHRAMANRTDKTRYMMKFQFIRMDEPLSPEWNVETPNWDGEKRNGNGSTSLIQHQGTWRHVWNWAAGQKNPNPSQANHRNLSACITALQRKNPQGRSRAADELGLFGDSAAEAVPMLIEALHDNYEPVRLNAAYALGTIGNPAVPGLIETLGDENGATRRIAAYALAAVGEPAVPTLSEALSHTEDAVRLEAAYALAQIGNEAHAAVPALLQRTTDACVEVRRYIAEAFGSIGTGTAAAVPALSAMLEGDDDDEVRFEAALALAKIGLPANDALRILTGALSDKNRYVRDNAVLALKRIDTPEAEEALLDYLLTSRWCAITNRESTF